MCDRVMDQHIEHNINLRTHMAKLCSRYYKRGSVSVSPCQWTIVRSITYVPLSSMIYQFLTSFPAPPTKRHCLQCNNNTHTHTITRYPYVVWDYTTDINRYSARRTCVEHTTICFCQKPINGKWRRNIRSRFVLETIQTSRAYY